MSNPSGNAEALVPAPPGNAYGLQHVAFSKRIIGERAQAIADGLMSLEWATPLDRLAAEEIASVIASLEAIDPALADGKVEYRGKARGLLATKATLTRELRSWLATFGALPSARADWTRKLLAPSFQELFEQKKREIEEASSRSPIACSEMPSPVRQSTSCFARISPRSWRSVPTSPSCAAPARTKSRGAF